MKRFDYGIILIEYLKTIHDSGEFLDVHTIAEQHDIPEAFLEKIAQDFKHAGLLESKRGFKGGYRLAVPPNALSMSTLFKVKIRARLICFSSKAKNRMRK